MSPLLSTDGLIRACLVVVLVPTLVLADWVPDAWVTLTTKTALLTAGELDATRIDVDTVDGRVTLHGTVTSLEQRRMAEEVAGRVAGARKVRNLLQVVSATQEGAVTRSDRELRRDIEALLASLRRSPGTDIRLQSLHKGVALLSGEAASAAEHLGTIRAVRRVRGVRAVASEVRVTDAPDADDVLAGHEFQADGRGAFDVTTDLGITAQAKLSLLGDPRIPALDVNVDTVEQVVTLFGIVSTAEAKSAAVERARQVAGVKRVEDRLQVVAGRNLETVQRRDDELRDAVTRRLRNRDPLARAVLRVEVQNGIVRLTGTVPSESHRLLAVTAARHVRGVRAVNEALEVRRIVDHSRKETTK